MILTEMRLWSFDFGGKDFLTLKNKKNTLSLRVLSGSGIIRTLQLDDQVWSLHGYLIANFVGFGVGHKGWLNSLEDPEI